MPKHTQNLDLERTRKVDLGGPDPLALNSQSVNSDEVSPEAALCWLQEQRRRQVASHPETIHQVVLTFPTNNLVAGHMYAVARVRGLDRESLFQEYVLRGLEADLASILSASSEGARSIGPGS